MTLLLGVLMMQVGGAVVRGGAGESDRLHLQQPRIVILKSSRRLHLFDGSRLVRSYPIALGTHPRGQKLCEGDGRTPEGRFHIATKNRGSKYHRFLGLDYPNLPAVERGEREGVITPGEAKLLHAARAEGRCPSWTTALGGAIGIHGNGAHQPGDGGDWTAGCIALSDQYAEELFEVMRIGDEVEILP